MESIREFSSASHPGLHFARNTEVTMAARELAERSSDGIVVRLYWDEDKPAGSDLFVTYRDSRWGVYYTLYPPRDRLLDAFLGQPVGPSLVFDLSLNKRRAGERRTHSRRGDAVLGALQRENLHQPEQAVLRGHVAHLERRGHEPVDR